MIEDQLQTCPHAQWQYNSGICNASNPLNTNFSSIDEYLAYVKTFGSQNCRDYPKQVRLSMSLCAMASHLLLLLALQFGGSWSLCNGKGCPNMPAPAFKRGSRTDVEGCCWWGRGSIQTTGPCNFGELNYYIGSKAATRLGQSLYPDVNFCTDPEVCVFGERKW